MTEQARQSLSCVAVIFHEQNAQRFYRLSRNLRIHAAFFDVVGDRVKCDRKGRAITSPAALPVDRAAMKIDKVFRNRQTQSKPTKLTTGRRVSLLEWSEERSLPFDFNSDPVISRSEERRVGKECRSRWGRENYKEQNNNIGNGND